MLCSGPPVLGRVSRSVPGAGQGWSHAPSLVSQHHMGLALGLYNPGTSGKLSS